MSTSEILYVLPFHCWRLVYSLNETFKPIDLPFAYVRVWKLQHDDVSVDAVKHHVGLRYNARYVLIVIVLFRHHTQKFEQEVTGGSTKDVSDGGYTHALMLFCPVHKHVNVFSFSAQYLTGIQVRASSSSVSFAPRSFKSHRSSPRRFICSPPHRGDREEIYTLTGEEMVTRVDELGDR